MKQRNTHHKWVHHGEEHLYRIANLKVFRRIEKMVRCNRCGTMKVKAKHISKMSDLSKKAKEVGELLFVDITGPFPLTTTK